MDIFAIFFLSCISVLFGIILTLTVQYYILYVYFNKGPMAKPSIRKNSVDYSLPQAIKKQIECEDMNDKGRGGSLPISLVLQFLFHELRHSEGIKRWLYKKLSLEFDELLTKTTIGKFFDSITIKDMHLGSEFPDIKDITVDGVKLDKKEGYIDTVSLCLNLDYTGNFLLSVDAKMKFGKTAYLSIKGETAVFKASVHPLVIQFFSDPVLDLAVESHFQGRQLQSNITNLIVNQIKKAIKRKHTLPNYKIRYKPFFVKTDPSQLDLEDNEIVPQGQLEVTCVEISRLSLPAGVQNIYCAMAVDAIPWISLYQKENGIYMTLEITMSKVRQMQLGVIFKQEQGLVIVDSVSPHSIAFKSGLRSNDVVLAIENRPIQSVPQIAKFIKSISAANITLRVERIAENYILKTKYNDETEVKVTCATPEPTDDGELTQTEQDTFIMVETPKDTRKRVQKIIPSNENMAKFAQTIGNFSLRKRKASFSETGSAKNTPTSSNPGTPQHIAVKQHGIHVPLSVKKNSLCELPEIVRTDSENADSEIFTPIEVHKSKELTISTVLQFNEDFQFTLKDCLKYLNINVWATLADDKDLLIGYTNIPISHVLGECCNSFLGHYMRCYSFLPPNNVIPNNQTHPLLSHSGFEHVFCYGDILLAFIWTHDEDIELKRRMSMVTVESDSKSVDSTGTTMQHDFIRTQFHRTTHCDFCSKKIWLKDAVQCKQCGMCCHKKCIVKCQMSTGCNPTLKSEISVSDVILQPEITTTEVDEEITDSKNFGNGLKRVNSVNNLAIPGSQFVASTSRSLPPSPQRTPTRKQSLISINPFSICPEILEEVQKNPSEATDNVNRLLEQVMQCPPDELLMDAAKDTGRQMYANMPHEERVEKINIMMGELKKTLDSVTLEHMELSKRIGTEESEVEKARLAFLMGQADAKVHGLSVLMLHYCSSLQHTQEKIV